MGYILAGIKTVFDAKPGDTITHTEARCAEPLPGFREVLPVVFSSIYPISSDDYEDLGTALEKLQLNDASLYKFFQQAVLHVVRRKKGPFRQIRDEYNIPYL